MISVYVGYDPRESGTYHAFCQSVIERSSVPVQFIPLHTKMLNGFNGQQDGTNAFIYSRYLIPYLQSYNGWAIFVDGDMTCLGDIADLWAQREKEQFNTAVMVVKHDYKTKFKRKFIGTPLENSNVDYPRKNWSSVMLWHCGHYSNRILTPEYVSEAGGKALHRFEWLRDEQIGSLSADWNVLVGEQAIPETAKLLHFTLGAAGFFNYADCDGSQYWHKSMLNAVNMSGENPVDMIRRACERT